MESTDKVVEKTNLFLQYLENSVPALLDFGVKVVLSLLIYFIGVKIIRLIRKVLKRGMERAGVDAGVKTFLDSLAKIGLYFLLIMLIATRFGITATSVAAILASAGLAIGLALQGSLANFAGGVLILIMKPFVVGDYIVTQTKEEGVVKEIRIFYTSLVTADNRKIVIPNGKLSDGIITNMTSMDKRRVDLSTLISYEADLLHVKSVMEELVLSEQKRLPDEEAVVFVDGLEESGVRLTARIWVATSDYLEVKWRLTESLKLSFDQNKIEIPYPHMDIRMKQIRQ